MALSKTRLLLSRAQLNIPCLALTFIFIFIDDSFSLVARNFYMMFVRRATGFFAISGYIFLIRV